MKAKNKKMKKFWAASFSVMMLLTGCSTPAHQGNAPAKESVKEEQAQSETTTTEEVKEEKKED